MHPVIHPPGKKKKPPGIDFQGKVKRCILGFTLQEKRKSHLGMSLPGKVKRCILGFALQEKEVTWKSTSRGK